MKTKPKTKLPSKKMADLMDEFFAKYNVSLDNLDSDDIDWICYFIGYRGVDENKSLEFFLNDNPKVLDYIIDYIVANAQKDWKSSFQRSLKEFDDLVMEDNPADPEPEFEPAVKPMSTFRRIWNTFFYGTPNPAVM